MVFIATRDLGDPVKLDERFRSYSEEASAINRKLRNPRLPPGRRDKLVFRHKDLVGRLMPEVAYAANR